MHRDSGKEHLRVLGCYPNNEESTGKVNRHEVAAGLIGVYNG